MESVSAKAGMKLMEASGKVKSKSARLRTH
jgi:hypothetical protein